MKRYYMNMASYQWIGSNSSVLNLLKSELEVDVETEENMKYQKWSKVQQRRFWIRRTLPSPTKPKVRSQAAQLQTLEAHFFLDKWLILAKRRATR